MSTLSPQQPQSPGQESSGRPRPRNIRKWIMGIGTLALLLLLCAGLLLTYWFPSELVRQQLEVRLSDLLKGTVRIESLSFNLLTGLSIRRAQYTREGHPPLKVETLELDYSLWKLMQGRLRINEIAVIGADLSLNLPELAQGAEPEQASAPPSDQPLIPVLPVTVDLDTVKFLQSTVALTVSPDLFIRLTGLDFTSSGGITSEQASLAGALDIQGVDLTFQGKNLQFPLTLSFDTSVDLTTEQIMITALTIQSDPTIRLSVSGSIAHPLTQKEVDIRLRDSQVDLAQLLRLGHPFIPEALATVILRGTVSPQITLTGSAPEGIFSGTLTGTIHTKGLETSLPTLDIQLGPTDMSLLVKDVRIQQNVPILGQAGMTGNVQQVRFQTYQVNQLELDLNGEFLDAGPFSGTLNVSGETTLPPEWVGQRIPLAFDVGVVGEGNHKTRSLKVPDLRMTLGTYGQLQGNATLQPRKPPSTVMDAAVDIRLAPNLGSLIPLIPSNLLQGLILEKGSGPDTLHLQVKGVLNQEYLPEAANLATVLKLSTLHAKVPQPAAQVVLDHAGFLLSADYQRATGTIKGTAGLSADIAKLSLPEQLSVSRSTATIKSTFAGEVTSAFQPTSLHSEDQLQIVAEDLVFSHPSMTASLPTIKLVVHAKEDPFAQNVVIEGLRLTAPELLELGLKGRWTHPTQQFDLDLRIPVLHLDHLLARLTGPLTEGLQGIKPTGILSMSLRTAGKVPSAADLQDLTLPLGFKGLVSLQDAGGTLGGVGVQGTNGTASLRYSRTAAHPLEFLTDLHMQTILFPEDLPLHELSNAALQIKLAAPSTNELDLTQFRVTSNGLDASVQGTLVGLQPFLKSSDPLGTRLADLFAEVKTQLDVDLGVFQQVLTPLNIQGGGKAGFGFHVHKKERGNLDSTVSIHTNQVSLKQATTILQNATGTIRLRKSLVWEPTREQDGPGKTFQPSDLIGQLRHLSDTTPTFTIKHLEVGPLTLKDFSTNLQFDQDTLKIQNISMNTLGGGLGGHVLFGAQRPIRLSAWFDAAKLDLNQLVNPQSPIEGDSEVDATVGLTVLLQEDTGALDLSQSEVQLHITHIGKEALDRLLVFLDPQGSKPTLAIARSQLKLANPSHVRIEIARGLLSLTIKFQGNLIPTFHLDRIPLAKMKNLERLTAAIPDWENISRLLKIVGGEGYSFTPAGGITIE